MNKSLLIGVLIGFLLGLITMIIYIEVIKKPMFYTLSDLTLSNKAVIPKNTLLRFEGDYPEGFEQYTLTINIGYAWSKQVKKVEGKIGDYIYWVWPIHGVD